MLVKKNGEAPETQMVVVGDAAFAQNQFLQLFEENAVFIENAVDVLSTGAELLGVRTKGLNQSPIAILTEGQRTTLRLIDIFLSPLLLIGLGVMLLVWRRSTARRLKAAYAA